MAMVHSLCMHLRLKRIMLGLLEERQMLKLCGRTGAHIALDYLYAPTADVAGLAAVALVVPADVAAAADVAPPLPAGPRPPMRWTPVNSGFVLRCIWDLVSKGARTEKGFKEVHVNQVAKLLKEFSGEEDHPKDANLLNRPIEFYHQMQVAFGSTIATGRFAMGSSEPLGVFSGFGDSEATKVEPGDFVQGAEIGVQTDKTKKAEGSKAEGGNCGTKRKRVTLSDDEVLIMTNMTDAVNNVAAALRESAPSHVDPALYDVVMMTPGFTEEALMAVLSFFFDSKSQGRGFLNMNDAHHVLWLRTWLAKHYYMKHYYVVFSGRKPGVYDDWPHCYQQKKHATHEAGR
ncbi:hypothetical protein EJB05_06882, partial [Eragrostis curvula]